jgi:hypothetical protein
MDKEQDDLTLVYMWAYKQAKEEYRDRIEELEAALQLYAGLERDGIKWEPLNDNGGVARAALGEKK